MPDLSALTKEQIPSSARLFKATIIAVITALIVLIVAVLPAEYGVDPTGLGSKLGLTGLSANQNQMGFFTSGEPYKSESFTLRLFPGNGTELKAVMNSGQMYIYNWKSTGELYMDMHAEEHGAEPDVFTSFWEEEEINSASGNMIAEFSGTHG
ncbi:MAG: hypothetical protein HKN08_11720, partial [Gammaproteobacteria bacterium]|nr:hypothetical protein [Gammaproteobacteria bacterium]